MFDVAVAFCVLDCSWLIWLVTLLGVIISCCALWGYWFRTLGFVWFVLCVYVTCLLYFVFVLCCWVCVFDLPFTVVGFYLGFACVCWCFVVRLV